MSTRQATLRRTATLDLLRSLVADLFAKSIVLGVPGRLSWLLDDEVVSGLQRQHLK